ncbi:MAG: YggT family protein [Peptococcaceae bacterium]|nr:YggT family protein [Peptococcaceae bacterium]
MNILSIVSTAFDILIYLIVARALLSFIPHDPHKSVFRFVYEITEPLLRPFRRFTVGSGVGIDFSPLIAIFLLEIVRNIVISLLGRFF